MNSAVIIPARYQSTRLPHKMLLKETGKYLVQHVYEQAKKAGLPQDVMIATDDERILCAATEFGAKAVLTGDRHRSGTDRVAQVAAGLDVDVVINVGGDEPLIDPGVIDTIIGAFQQDPGVNVATAAFEFSDPERARDENLVKVVIDNSGRALYFSRSPIPYYRGNTEERIYLGHVGIYGYRRDFLLKLAKMKETELEAAEKLEQLRVLQSGHNIKVVVTDYNGVGIDSREDYDRFLAIWKERNQQA